MSNPTWLEVERGKSENRARASLGENPRIVVAGAGSVGCYVGGCLALAGRDVTLLMREPLAEALSRHGLRIADLDGSERLLAPSRLKLATKPGTALRDAELILVTVKSGATAALAREIGEFAPSGAVVVSLQNGVDNAETLSATLRGVHPVIAGMVPFNVVQTRNEDEPPRFLRATNGTIRIAAGYPGLREALDVKGAPLAEHKDMTGVLWGKLVINLNNALNGLSGLTLGTELADRDWRLLLARQMDEALAVLAAAGIRPARIERMHPQLMPAILRLPDWLYRLLGRGLVTFHPEARSSMAEDLEARRPTEIDHLQGAVLALAKTMGRKAPLNARVAQLVRQAEQEGRGSPRLSPEAVAGRH